MITNEALERVRGWFTGRLPDEWQVEAPEITVDRDEITVVLTIGDVDLDEGASAAESEEARAGRVKGFREDTRSHRIEIAREAEHRYDRKVSWGVRVGDHDELFTHLASPVMTRLRQPQRQVLDTLVEAGVARSRSEALAWCVRLVGQHEGDWLTELREAMSRVADVRTKGPSSPPAS
jgi:Arc/MetJ-type ribon-helix-helix transcriptional regulator